MTNKLNNDQISDQIRTFITATEKHFDSYAYAAGALQAQLAYVLSDLPADKQQETLQVFAQLTAKYSKG